MKMESASMQRISKIKKSKTLLFHIDIEGDPDIQMRLDADDVWVLKNVLEQT